MRCGDTDGLNVPCEQAELCAWGGQVKLSAPIFLNHTECTYLG